MACLLVLVCAAGTGMAPREAVAGSALRQPAAQADDSCDSEAEDGAVCTKAWPAPSNSSRQQQHMRRSAGHNDGMANIFS
mmetsp:Transcript_108466/g.280474  ORF Transcript_108466/g.280474 Transcript_108466/m.280474 type:complete len:80 (+) Transcript_108466:368-607(+)